MTYPLYRVLLVALFVLVVGGYVFWVSLRPSRSTSRMGMRGLKRQQSLLSPWWGSIEPFVRWMGVRVSPLLDANTRAKVDEQLMHAGDFLGISPDEYIACIVVCGLIGAVIGGVASSVAFSMSPLLPAVMCGGLVAMVPYMVVDNARVERFKAISRGLPYAIDLMALSMSAGLDFPGSVQQVVEKAKANEFLREELAYMLQQLQLGRTRTQVLRELATRTPLESVREFVQAIIQAEERGNPVSTVLELQAQTARARRSNAAEKAASDMNAKMVLPAMMLVGVSLMLVAIPSTMMIEKLSGGVK